MRSHLVIPDTQVAPGVPINHLEWIGKYIVAKKPEVIIHLGDHADMESLCSYDKGTRGFEGRRYHKDITAAKDGMAKLMQPLRDLNEHLRNQKHAQYRPEMHLLLGNHENRINRATQSDAVLDGTIGVGDLCYGEYEWTVHEFLEPIDIDGIRYSHYFPRSPSGRVLQTNRGAPSASAQVKREMVSCTAGHLQGLDFYIAQGLTRKYGLICGSCYLHDEEYLGPQGNAYWRGIIWKHQVLNGEYDITTVSLDFLCRKYEGMGVDEFLKTDRVEYA